jgi:hypothetical protein
LQRASDVPSLPILVALIMVKVHSSETSVLTRITRRNIPEGGILHSHRRENLKSYVSLNGWALWRRRNDSLVRYELGFYIPEDGVLHNHRREKPQIFPVVWNYTVFVIILNTLKE